MADKGRTATQMRDMAPSDLLAMLEEIKRDLFNLRVRTTTKEETDPNAIGIKKREVARIMTILNEKRREESAASAS